MNWTIFKHPAGLNLLGVIILVVGLASAALIYRSAGEEAHGALGYEVVDGASYPIMPGNSKVYRHNLELYGGKFNVMMDDFRRWFLGLWRGRSLAFMVALITSLTSFGFFYAANYLVPRRKSGGHPENNPDNPG